MGTAPAARTEPRRASWDQETIDSVKASVKEELDRAAVPDDPRARLHAALVHVERLADDDSDLGRLRRYVFIVSSLVEHERHGGLSAREAENLVTLAYAILQIQGVRARSSRLSALYGDLHLIRSQIYRKDGQPWQAAWEQQIALHLSGAHPSGGEGFQTMVLANRSLRLGHTSTAIRQFRHCEALGVVPAYWARVRLGLLQSLWLARRHDEADDVRASTLASPDLPAAIREEFEWNGLVRQMQLTQDLSPLLAAIAPHSVHRQASYVIETCFWGSIVKSREFLPRLPRLQSLSRNKELHPQRLGAWYRSGTVLQDCYDFGLALPSRIRALGDALAARDGLVTVDKELLLLGAALRWLRRSKATDIAGLVADEYRALSLRLTEGASPDATGLLGDASGPIPDDE